MANTIQVKRKTSAGAPTVGSLADGEMCLVVPDSLLYQRVDSSTLISFVPAQVLTQTAYDALTQSQKDASGLVIISG